MVTYWLKGERVAETKNVNKNLMEIKKQKSTDVGTNSVNNGSIRNVRILKVSDNDYPMTEEAAVPLLSVTTVNENKKKF